MPLTLTIENETTLPDGGPVSVTLTGKRGLDIGRDRHLDWTLPDPSRQISGKHCEIRFRDGEYWLTDVSTNGTYVNGSDTRVQSPLRLRSGDRLAIGHYLIKVEVTGAEAEPPPAAEPERPLAEPAQDSFNPWHEAAGAAPPAPVEDVRPVRPPKVGGTPFLDWAADVPAPAPASTPEPPPPPAVAEDLSWASPPPSPPAPLPEPAPAVPMPRRPAPPAAAPSEPPPAAAAPVLPEFSPPSSVAEPPPASAAPPPQAPRRSIPDFAPPPQSQPDDVIGRLAAGLGVPAETFAGRPAGDVAQEIGQALRLVTENLRQLLSARTQAKQMVRSGSHTAVQALDNNPLKFAPSTDEALRVMYGPPTPSFLPGDRAFAQAFSDLKSHQVKTYGAMQMAIMRLEKELSPASVEEAVGKGGGLSALLGSRKAHLWDVYTARWTAKTAHREHGLSDAFMLEFADCYDQQ